MFFEIKKKRRKKTASEIYQTVNSLAYIKCKSIIGKINVRMGFFVNSYQNYRKVKRTA